MAIVNTNIEYRLSGGASNAVPSLSHGGAKSSTAMSTDLFDDVSSAEASAGEDEYRCIYIHNGHGSLTMENSKIWIATNSPSPDTLISIAAGTSAINGTEQSLPDGYTEPSGVSWSEPALEANAVALGNIPFGQHKAVWIRRRTSASAAAYNNDTFTLRVKCDTAA